MKVRKLVLVTALLILIISIIYIALIYSRREGKGEFIESLFIGVERGIKVSSRSFSDGEYIPIKYTCEDRDISPSIIWSDIPPEAKSLLILMYDPDAPGGYFIHWVAYNVPPDIEGIDEGLSGRLSELKLGLEARNDFGNIGYDGPCPPKGSTHRYYIVVFALDRYIDLREGAPALDVLKSAADGIIAYGVVMGRYGR